ERLDAEPVAGADEGLPGLVPQREGEHAPEMVHALVAPLPVRAEDHFGVGGRDELLAPELLTELQIVVDLPVIGDTVPSAVRHRLLPSGQVDDTETPVGEADDPPRVMPGSLAVRPPVLEERIHRVYGGREAGRRLQRQVQDRRDAAHRQLLEGGAARTSAIRPAVTPSP